MIHRVVVVVKRLEDRYQAQLRCAAGSNVLFFGRRESRSSNAKRQAEELFGPLLWSVPPERLQQSEPEVLQVAYLDITVSQ